MGYMICGPLPGSSRNLFWNGRSESAEEILDRRYAEGEIGRDEYEGKKRDMERTEA